MTVLKNVLNNDIKFCLIGKIKGLAIESKRARAYQRSKKDPIMQSKASNRKLVVCADARHHLLAYAILRGIPYSAVENKCRQDNKPNIFAILRIIHNHVSAYEVNKWTDIKIVSWLAGE